MTLVLSIQRSQIFLFFYCLVGMYSVAISQVDSASAWTALDEGDAYIEEEAYQEALPLYTTALPYFDSLDNHDRHFHILFWLGEIYYIVGDFQKAKDVSLDADSIAVNYLKRETLDNYAQLLVNLGVFYSALGDLDMSLQAYQTAFAFSTQYFGRESEEVVNAYFSLGAVYKHLGQVQRSIAMTDTAAQIAQSIGYNGGQAAAYNNLAFIYSELNDFSKAITYQERAMEIVDNRVDSAVYLNNLGIYLLELGALENAISEIQKSLDLRMSMYPAGHPFLGSTILNLGSVYFTKGDYDSTLRLTNEIIENYDPQQPGNAYMLQLALIHEGSVRFIRKEYKAAEECARKSLDIPEKQGHASSYFVLANALLEQGFLLEALQNIQLGIVQNVTDFSPKDDLSLPDEEMIDNYPVLIDLLVSKTKILQELAKQLKDNNYALEAFKTARYLDNLVGKARLFKKDYVSQELLAADLRDFYSLALANCADLFFITSDSLYLRQAYYYSARNKALQISERLSKSAIDTLAGVERAIVARESRLKSEIDFITNKLRYRSFFSPDQVLLWDKQLLALQRDREAVLRELQEKAPAYFDLVHQNSLSTIEDIQNVLLQPGQVVLEYFISHSGYIYVFFISKESVVLRKLSVPDDISNLIKTLRNSINNQSPDFYGYSYEAYRILVQPMEDLLSDQEELVIIPDGIIGLLPFELLISEPWTQGNTPAYILFDYRFRYLFTSKQGLVSQMKNKESSNGKILGLAPSFSKGLVHPATIRGKDSIYLPALAGNQIELNNLKRNYKGTYLFGQNAIKSALEAANGYAVLHISTHALTDDQFPAFSHLLLKNDQRSDYEPLYAYELLEKAIKTDLIVLSACNTGFGKLQKGQGIASLASAFAYAGSPNLIMSLWPVQDQTTPELMSYFYKYLERGFSKGESLRQAKLAFLNQDYQVYSHPYYWASFIYVGDDESVNISRKMSFKTYPLLAGVTLILILFIGFRIRSRRA